MSDAKWLPEVDPNPAEPRMVIWATLRCLELQIDQHEELYNSDGVVSWELLKHMVRLSKRHAHEEGNKIGAAERETDQWRTRSDEANAKLRETEQELDRLRKVHMEFQSEELTEARATIADLQRQLDAARAETVETRKRLNDETDRHRATNAEKVDLFQKLQWANQHNVELVRERDAARETILAQKRGNQYLRMLIDKVRGIVRCDEAMSDRLEEIENALDEFDQGTLERETEPAQVAEPAPCPERELSEEMQDAVSPTWAPLVSDLRRRLRESQQARGHELERLQAFVSQVRSVVNSEWYGIEMQTVRELLAQLDAGTEPTPVAEPIDAEGGQ